VYSCCTCDAQVSAVVVEKVVISKSSDRLNLCRGVTLHLFIAFSGLCQERAFGRFSTWLMSFSLSLLSHSKQSSLFCKLSMYCSSFTCSHSIVMPCCVRGFPPRILPNLAWICVVLL